MLLFVVKLLLLRFFFVFSVCVIWAMKDLPLLMAGVGFARVNARTICVKNNP